MAEIQNRCDQPECEKWVCSSEEVCSIYTSAVTWSCKNILNKDFTRADEIMLSHLNRGCTKPN
jgi:hypothetical protein